MKYIKNILLNINRPNKSIRQRIASYAILFVMLLLLAFVVSIIHHSLGGFLARQFILDGTENNVIVEPTGITLFIHSKQNIKIYNTPDNSSTIGDLTPRAVIYKTGQYQDFTSVEVLGWIWNKSICYQNNSTLNVCDSVKFENLRVEANSIIIGKLNSMAPIHPLFKSKNGAWVFCKIVGWIESSYISESNNSNRFSNMYPVLTVRTEDGGDFSNRMRIHTLYDSLTILIPFILMIVVLTFSLGIRLIRGGKIFGHDIFQQIHKGEGDNVAGNKNTHTD